MPHPPARQRISWGHDQRVDGGDLRNAGERPQTLGAKIGFGKDAEDARSCPRRGDVDPFDRGMGVGRTQDMEVGRPGNGDIVDVPAATRQKPEVFEPSDRASERIGVHHRPPSAED
jgi:hypothetical protein